MKAIIIFFLLYSCSSTSSKLIRLDKVQSEDLALDRLVVALLITEDCSVCQSQLSILKNCVVQDRVAVFIEGEDEEKLRQVVRKKKINFPTYRLDQKSKKLFSFGDLTPTLAVKSGGSFKTHVGLISCEETIKLIKSRP